MRSNYLFARAFDSLRAITLKIVNNSKFSNHMKRTAIFAVCFFALFSINLSAQQTNVWKGGAPGHETDWHYYKNWSLGQTPDVFDAVVIPDVSTTTNRYPQVSSGQIEVQSLEIQSGAVLRLSRTASILTENFVSNGACEDCGLRIILEGNDKPSTASAGN